MVLVSFVSKLQVQWWFYPFSIIINTKKWHEKKQTWHFECLKSFLISIYENESTTKLPPRSINLTSWSSRTQCDWHSLSNLHKGLSPTEWGGTRLSWTVHTGGRGGADLYSLRLLSLKRWSHNGYAPPMKHSWPPLTLYQWRIGVLCIPLLLLCPRVPCGHCLGIPPPLCVLFPLATPAPVRLASLAPGERRGHTSKSPECHTPVRTIAPTLQYLGPLSALNGLALWWCICSPVSVQAIMCWWKWEVTFQWRLSYFSIICATLCGKFSLCFNFIQAIYNRIRDRIYFSKIQKETYFYFSS